MQKRGLPLLLLIASLSFVSAQMPTSIGDVFDAFGGENLLLLGTFVISLTLINFILGRVPVFKDKVTGKRNKKVPAIISTILSLFIVYGIYKSQFDLAGFFYGLGLEQSMLEIIIVIAILAGLAFLFWKLKSWTLLLLGLALIALSFTDLVFESGVLLILGIGLVILWFLVKMFTRKKKDETPSEDIRIGDSDRQSQRDAEEREKQRRMQEAIAREKALKEQLEAKQKEAQKAKQKAEMMERRRRSLGELKRLRSHYVFKKNQNIPKREGESSEDYQARKKRRQKKVQNIIDAIDKRIKAKG
jgi:hypothetical protein